jgi:phage shock protein E
MKLSFLHGLFLAAALAGIQAAEPEHPSATQTPQGPTSKSAFKTVEVQEFEKLRADKKNVVLDVRTAKEYAAGHIPGAVNIDVNSPDFEKKVAALDTNKTYLVHCAAGVRSAKACEKLTKLQFPHLYNLGGGMKAWEKAGNKPQP